MYKQLYFRGRADWGREALPLAKFHLSQLSKAHHDHFYCPIWSFIQKAKILIVHRRDSGPLVGQHQRIENRLHPSKLSWDFSSHTVALRHWQGGDIWWQVSLTGEWAFLALIYWASRHQEAKPRPETEGSTEISNLKEQIVSEALCWLSQHYHPWNWDRVKLGFPPEKSRQCLNNISFAFSSQSPIWGRCYSLSNEFHSHLGPRKPNDSTHVCPGLSRSLGSRGSDLAS